jgi:hypothetical protein
VPQATTVPRAAEFREREREEEEEEEEEGEELVLSKTLIFNCVPLVYVVKT